MVEFGFNYRAYPLTKENKPTQEGIGAVFLLFLKVSWFIVYSLV